MVSRSAMMESKIPLDWLCANRYRREMVDPHFHKKLEETRPKKLDQMEIEDLKKYEQYFSERLPFFAADVREQGFRQQCQDRISELRSERQHRDVSGTGKKTLFWARWAVVAAVVVP